MFMEGAWLTDLENKIIHEAGSYSLGRDQSRNCHTLELQDLS